MSRMPSWLLNAVLKLEGEIARLTAELAGAREIAELRVREAEEVIAENERLRELSVWGTSEPVGPTYDVIARLTAENKRLRELVQEELGAHCDPEMHWYNDCDTDPCLWCSNARAVLEGER